MFANKNISAKPPVNLSEEDYRGEHQAPNKTKLDSPMYDVTNAFGEDFYEVDKKTYTVKAQNSGKIITLGDKIKVKLRGIDMDLKTIDFQVLG